jgi:hypothetical protein
MRRKRCFRALIEAEATAVIGAGPHLRTPDRVTERNGHRDRLWTTAVRVRADRQSGQLFAADRVPHGVASGVQFGCHAQAAASSCGSDAGHHDLVAGQGPAAPIHRDVGKQKAMFLAQYPGPMPSPCDATTDPRRWLAN